MTICVMNFPMKNLSFGIVVGKEILVMSREELIQLIHDNVGPWVALNGWTMFGNQVLGYVESMTYDKLIMVAREFNLIDW